MKSSMKTELWIARDKNGRLWLYDGIPVKYDISYNLQDGLDMVEEISPDLFPEVTFESGPVPVQLIRIVK